MLRIYSNISWTVFFYFFRQSWHVLVVIPVRKTPFWPSAFTCSVLSAWRPDTTQGSENALSVTQRSETMTFIGFTFSLRDGQGNGSHVSRSSSCDWEATLRDSITAETELAWRWKLTRENNMNRVDSFPWRRDIRYVTSLENATDLQG